MMDPWPVWIEVPLATYEFPLWPSVSRGARISRMVEGGIAATLVDERMTRSVLVEADTAESACTAARAVHDRIDDLRVITRSTSRCAELLTVRHEIAGPLLFLRFEFSPATPPATTWPPSPPTPSSATS